MSTDAWGAYTPAIRRFFGNRANYAIITKFYASQNPGPGRYAPPRVSGTQITEVLGVPNYSKVHLLCRAAEFDAPNEDC